MRQRLRLGVAAILVIASLVALSAWLKNGTCNCGSSGLPWEPIAIGATISAGVSGAIYVIVNNRSGAPMD